MDIPEKQRIEELEEKLKQREIALALVTAEKLALETLHGKLPAARPAAVVASENDKHSAAEAVKARVEAQAQMQEMARLHEEKMAALVQEHRVKLSALRESISSLNQETELSKNGKLAAEEKMQELISTFEDETQGLQSLQVQHQALAEAHQTLSVAHEQALASIATLQHERVVDGEAIHRLQSRVFYAENAVPQKRRFGLKDTSEQEAMDSAIVRQAHLETKIAEELAAQLRERLNVAEKRIEMLKKREFASAAQEDLSGT